MKIIKITEVCLFTQVLFALFYFFFKAENKRKEKGKLIWKERNEQCTKFKSFCKNPSNYERI